MGRPVMSSTDFDLFRLSEDHDALREAVRAGARGKIAPYAAGVDQQARFPQEAVDALVATDVPAPPVPAGGGGGGGAARGWRQVSCGGVGADALATCMVIEEVARVCATSSLIPGCNKLGSLPLMLGGSEELKRRYLTPLAQGLAAFSYGLSEREAGSDTASMTARAT